VLNQPGGDAGYALVEATHAVGEPRIRDHMHDRHEETFVVLEGQYEVRLGEDIVAASAGDYVFVPRGTPHTYRNSGSTPGRVLNIISPPDGVDLLAELGALAGTPIDEPLLRELHARHSARLVSPLRNW
jgi:mannose-6-phosphate isomerase-like protein (cupin superfamily)